MCKAYLRSPLLSGPRQEFVVQDEVSLDRRDSLQSHCVPPGRHPHLDVRDHLQQLPKGYAAVV